MKNRILFLGSLCLIMAFGLVISGCPAEVQTIDFASIGAPKNVEVSLVNAVTTGTDQESAHILIKWDAVKNASGYSIVASQDGAKTWITIEWTGWVVHKWTDGVSTSTTQTEGYNSIASVDKWQGKVYLNDWYGYNNYPTTNIRGSIKFGVIAHSRTNDKNPSKPAWVDAINIPVQTRTY